MKSSPLAGLGASPIHNSLLRPASWRLAMICACLIFAAAMACHALVAASQPVFLDELFAHLAAQSLHNEGVPRIYEGFYSRAAAYTQLISLLASDNLIIERMPAAVFGALLVSGVFAWVSHRVGFAAAALSASMLACSDVSLKLSGYVRFYTLHAFVLFVATAIIFEALHSRRSWALRGGAMLIAISLIGFAANLQPTTVILVASLGGWLAGLLIYRSRNWIRSHQRLTVAAFAALIILAMAGLVLGWRLGLDAVLKPMVEEFFSASAWNRSNSSSIGYYLAVMMDSVPGLLLLSPLAFYCGLRVAPGPVSMSAIIFILCAAALSIGGMKNERYLFFAMPFFYVVIGTGVVGLVRTIAQGAKSIRAGYATPAHDVSSPWPGRLAAPCLSLSLVAALVLNPSLVQGASLVLRAAGATLRCPDCFESRLADGAWTERDDDLSRALADKPFILTTDPFRAVHYLGRYDAAVVSYIRTPYAEFVLDPRSGRPSISLGRSLAAIQACHAKGVVLVTNKSWPDPSRVSDDFRRQLERTTTLSTFVGRENSIFAFSWDRPEGLEPAFCAELAARLGHHSAGDPAYAHRPQFIP